jgi:hypothetical protein
MAYAVALQVILAGFAAGHLGAAGDFSGDAFVLCLSHAGGADSEQGGSGQQPVDQAPCVFCTLATGACAILPVEHSVSIIPTFVLLHTVDLNHDQVVEYGSPTGQYQRGPPAADFAVG